MINAIEWFQSHGFSFDDKITIKDVLDLQNDALSHAAQLVHDMSRGTRSEDRANAIDEARDVILQAVAQQTSDVIDAAREVQRIEIERQLERVRLDKPICFRGIQPK